MCKAMATLHLMIGLPCSGKTTRAKQLETEYNALLLTPDVWHLKLFGHDMDRPTHDESHDAVEKVMWDVAARVLSLGVDVILDFGCWAKSERDEFRRRAAALGAGFRLHYMDVPEDELFRRMEIRNVNNDGNVFVIPRECMKQYISVFEPPTLEELQ